MNIDLIKWKVGYAEGFEWKDDGYITIITTPTGTQTIEGLIKDKIMYPLLLQRAIEGINKKGKYEISMFKDRIYVSDYSKTFGIPYYFTDYGWSPDQAKTQALKYIYGQE